MIVPVCYLICGFLGAGKTTYSQKLAKETGAIHLNPEQYCMELFDKTEYEKNWDKCFSETIDYLWKKAEEYAKNGKSVIFDMGFWTKISRDEATQRAKAEKIIIVLTRPAGYRKKNLHPDAFYKLFYKKFPNFIAAGISRHKTYNETLDLIEKYESAGKIIVLRPSKTLKIKRVEKDTAKLQNMYDLGVSDCLNKLDEIKTYLKR